MHSGISTASVTPQPAFSPRPLAVALSGALLALTGQVAWSQQAAPSSAAAQGAVFRLTEVRFSPTVAVSQEELQEAVKPFIGRDVNSGDLLQVSNTVRRLYESRGFGLMGIGFVNQDLNGGVLQVTIVEPRVTRLIVDSTGKPPVSDERVNTVLADRGVQQGKPLNLEQLDRAMFTLNDWPGVKAKTTLTPSGDEGAYTVAVQTERGRAWDASIDADNHGSSASGKYRVGALLRWNNPLSVGDNLDLRLVASDGSGNTVGRLGYEIPVGATPWRFGAGYSRVAYQLDDTALGAQGTASVFDASLSYPLLRSRDQNLVGRVAVENKRLSDEFGVRTEKHLQVVSANLSYESRDGLGGGGFNGGGLGVQAGRVKNADGVDASTLGKFGKVTYQFTRLQSVTRRVSLFGGIGGQWASKNLDNAEKFTLGGARGVRAYPTAEAASDIGMLLNAELRFWVNPQWSTYLFHDTGRGKIQKNPTTTGNNKRTLHANGVGVQYSNPEIMTVKATVGVRGDEQVLSDSEKGKTMVLVQVQHAF